jgi:hypothetical protein
MFLEDNDTITITPKNPEAKWVAIDQSNKIISEGQNPNEVIDAAKKITDNFTIMFVPKKGNTYIF